MQPIKMLFPVKKKERQTIRVENKKKKKKGLIFESCTEQKGKVENPVARMDGKVHISVSQAKGLPEQGKAFLAATPTNCSVFR
jgi:hypothetical protein